MKSSNVVLFIICVGVPLAVGAIAGTVTAESIGNWYATIEKPSFNPPNSVFGPVWTALYILMGIAMFIAWKASFGAERTQAATVFGIQLLLNFAWSFIFFYFHQPGWAFAEILVLWGVLLYTIIVFYKIKNVSAYLLIPYILWVSFAAVLNASIWKLNT